MDINERSAGWGRQGSARIRRLVPAIARPLLISCVLALAWFFTSPYLPNRIQGMSQALPAMPSQPVTVAWFIKGGLTEACTCTVPCTCNFGEAPSPHDYCYSFYSYDIQQGKYGDVTLDGLHFGATELKTGRTMFIDERANEQQRAALRVIAARVIERLSAEEADRKAKTANTNLRYAAIKQEHGDRHNHLEVAGVGEFAADYILGLDKSTPLIVRNNTTWHILDAIKAKTTVYRVKVGNDVINTKDTNSNQGDFTYTDKTDFGQPGYSNCGANMNSKLSQSKSNGEKLCGM